MKRLFPILLSAVWGGQAVRSQTMSDVFASMLDSVLEVMTKNNRLDCIDFIENEMEAKVHNRFDGYSVLKTLTLDFLDLQLTETCRVEMKLLPVSDSVNYICMVRTYSGPVQESTVSLYTPDWKKLSAADYLPAPSYAGFWSTNDTIDANEVARLQRLQDMHFVTATLQPDDMRLTYVLQPGEVEKEEAARMQDVLHPQVFEWNGKRFLPVNRN